MMNKLYFTLIVFCFALYSCSYESDNKTELIRPVKTTKITKRESDITNKISGTIISSSESYSSFKSQGTIKSILVNEGDFVKKGQIIALLEDENRQESYAAAKSKYNQTSAEVARVVELYEKGSVAKNEYEKAISGLQSISSAYEISQNNLSDCQLHAPISGVIQEIMLAPGQFATPASSVVHIIGEENLNIQGYIPTSLFMNKNNIIKCYATSSIINDSIPINISFLSSKANNNQLHKIKFEIPSKFQSKLSIGMVMSIAIVVKNNQEGTLTIPISACFIFENNTYVWCINTQNMSVYKKKITTSNINSKGYINILDGLDGSETIVTAGVNMLNENQKIRIITE